MLESTLGWILFPLGVALGWYLATRAPGSHATREGPALLSGIRTLAKDDPDQAIAELIRVEELNEEAVELHLTLGSLFRRRGEVDRALRVHESLLARQSLSTAQRNRTEYELAHDYDRAGMLDRAEQIFRGLADRGFKVLPSLENVIRVLENSRDWERAVEASHRLEAASGSARKAITAQYFCEMAEEAMRKKQVDEAQRHLSRALSTDRHNARANLLKARVAQSLQRWSEATNAYARTASEEPRLLPELVRPLWECCRDWGKPEYFVNWLDDLPEEQRIGAADVIRAELLEETSMPSTIYLLDAFDRRPNWSVLERIASIEDHAEDAERERATDVLRRAVLAIGRSRIRYQCQSCGMTPAQLFWHCPSCKQWGTIFPMDDRLEAQQQQLP